MLRLVYSYDNQGRVFQAEAFCLRPRAEQIEVLAFESPQAVPVLVATFSERRLIHPDGTTIEPHRIQLAHQMKREDSGDRIFISFDAPEQIHVENDSLYLQTALMAPAGTTPLTELRSSATLRRFQGPGRSRC